MEARTPHTITDTPYHHRHPMQHMPAITAESGTFRDTRNPHANAEPPCKHWTIENPLRAAEETIPEGRGRGNAFVRFFCLERRYLTFQAPDPLARVQELAR